MQLVLYSGNDLIKNPIIKLGDSIIERVDSLVHLGMPIGKNKFVEDFFCQKFRNEEKSYYSLYGIGCRPDGINFEISANIYKKFCQSSFYYGLETNYISKTTLNKLNIRQSIIVMKRDISSIIFRNSQRALSSYLLYLFIYY